MEEEARVVIGDSFHRQQTDVSLKSHDTT
jgi:hypothetical protein